MLVSSNKTSPAFFPTCFRNELSPSWLASHSFGSFSSHIQPSQHSLFCSQSSPLPPYQFSSRHSLLTASHTMQTMMSHAIVSNSRCLSPPQTYHTVLLSLSRLKNHHSLCCHRGVYGVTQLVSGGWPPHESRLEHRLVALLLGSFGLSSPRLLPLSALDAGLFVARFTRQLDQLVQIS